MSIIAVILSAIADMIWGGQASRFSRALHSGRRVIAPALVALGLMFAIGLIPALISALGYTLVRWAGWRFKPVDDELFLTMEKPRHALFASIYGVLGFSAIPLLDYFALQSETLVFGLIYWAAYSVVVTIPWAAIMFISRRIGKDFLPLKEAVWGGMFALAAYYYFTSSAVILWLENII